MNLGVSFRRLHHFHRLEVLVEDHSRHLDTEAAPVGAEVAAVPNTTTVIGTEIEIGTEAIITPAIIMITIGETTEGNGGSDLVLPVQALLHRSKTMTQRHEPLLD